MRIGSLTTKHSATNIEQSQIHLLFVEMMFEWSSLITYPMDADFIQCLLEAFTLIFTQSSTGGL